MGLFNEIGRVWGEAKKSTGDALHKVYQGADYTWQHGGREALIYGGLAAGTILTGGALGLVGAGATGVAGAAGALGTAAVAGGAAALYGGYSGGETGKMVDETNAQIAKQEAEIAKENAKADAANRANLLSLRKKVGAVNVGSKSTVFSGGSTNDNKATATGVVLG